MKKKIIMMVLIVALATIIASCNQAMGYKGLTYNVEDYIDVSYYGKNGEAHAYVDFDNLSLAMDIEKGIINEDKEAFRKFGGDRYDLDRRVWEYINDIEVDLSPKDDIKNGDVLIATISYDNEIITDFNFRFSGEKVEVVVEGLEE